MEGQKDFAAAEPVQREAPGQDNRTVVNVPAVAHDSGTAPAAE